ncbi:MAG: hypothetical protein U0103_15970 [Candidatus Obscuribacterales bacterium]|nr:hypothetical protein [Cyanobacteria bacterium SZAS LIN-5]RTL38087.1 MAG: hypothetical protein EKK48_22580 [Candidatus Melainabacteria bacterium]
MTLAPYEICLLSAALLACLALGSLHLRVNLWLFSFQALLIAAATINIGSITGDQELCVIGAVIGLLKALVVPAFLAWISEKLMAQRDMGTFLPAPLSMHLCIVLFVLSFALAKGIPSSEVAGHSWLGVSAGISLLLSGLILMLTRRLAISQVVGFLVIENGIYTFALTQTKGMPLMVEMGILLDLLVAVMVSGLLIFKIQKSFEHIDIAQLSDLRD